MTVLVSHILSIFVAAASVFSGWGTHAPAQLTWGTYPGGSFDLVVNGKVYGWACDSADFSKPLDVHVYADGQAGKGGTFLLAAKADIDRHDPGVTQVCNGHPKHAFVITLPEGLKDGSSHTLFVYAIGLRGVNPILPGSPRTVQTSAGQSSSRSSSTIANSSVSAAASSISPLTMSIVASPMQILGDGIVAYDVTLTSFRTLSNVTLIVAPPVPDLVSLYSSQIGLNSDMPQGCVRTGAGTTQAVCAIGTLEAGETRTVRLQYAYVVGRASSQSPDVCGVQWIVFHMNAQVQVANEVIATAAAPDVRATCGPTTTLTSTVSVAPQTINRGEATTFTITVTNTGQYQAHSITSVVDFRGGETRLSLRLDASASSPECGLYSAYIACRMPSLDPGASQTFTIRLHDTAGPPNCSAGGIQAVPSQALAWAANAQWVQPASPTLLIQCPVQKTTLQAWAETWDDTTGLDRTVRYMLSVKNTGMVAAHIAEMYLTDIPDTMIFIPQGSTFECFNSAKGAVRCKASVDVKPGKSAWFPVMFSARACTPPEQLRVTGSATADNADMVSLDVPAVSCQ